ncbi:protein PHLOEM PROTEIN 2-LIKE A10-like [Coffea arabica]|uniref:Protein PHLOEM PROTEIN 2-LIKE A10-like n=1 Tax=Coffea arabica TaxID=13443 RepID=A0A6P6UPH0_COFAR|nr:protein PHLOEM PROTEIN 2-LIKE A10-like [Coffea arabica]XP_027092445.1 protein PHLOEM PROTEIN 2-LIKE A10-like [Coffea arabica]
MDLDLMKRGLHYTREKKKWLIILGLVGFSSYGAYKVYHLPGVAKKRRRLLKLLEALFSVAEMVSKSSDTISIVCKDFKEFLLSDSDEIPTSLKQLSKIARSDQLSGSLTKVSEAIAIGVLRAYRSENRGETEEVGKSDFSDRFLDKLTSSAGTGFVSVVVGSFARNLVMGFRLNGELNQGLNGDGHNGMLNVNSSSLSMPGWVNVVCDDRCKVLIADCIKTFVSTAVAVYLDKTMDINIYDELFSGLTNPKHQNQVGDILVSLFNGAVETFVKTSHQVLTASKPDLGSNSNFSCSPVDQNEAASLGSNKLQDREVALSKIQEGSRSINTQNNGWVSSVSSTLAVPSNRKFVLDVTGRVTFETIRSLVEFFFWKISEVLKRSFAVIREDIIDRGLEVIRYVGAKSAVILTICLALLLHVLGSGRVLLPA